MDEEQMMWNKGILGTSTPQSLLNAVFYLIGQSFCLRGGEEHRQLCISQVVWQFNPVCYVYTETGSKNKKDTFMEMHIQNKVVPFYSSPAAEERCHVHILDTIYRSSPKMQFKKISFIYVLCQECLIIQLRPGSRMYPLVEINWVKWFLTCAPVLEQQEAKPITAYVQLQRLIFSMQMYPKLWDDLHTILHLPQPDPVDAVCELFNQALVSCVEQDVEQEARPKEAAVSIIQLRAIGGR